MGIVNLITQLSYYPSKLTLPLKLEHLDVIHAQLVTKTSKTSSKKGFSKQKTKKQI